MNTCESTNPRIKITNIECVHPKGDYLESCYTLHLRNNFYQICKYTSTMYCMVSVFGVKKRKKLLGIVLGDMFYYFTQCYISKSN